MVTLVYSALNIAALTPKDIEAHILFREANGEIPIYREGDKIIFEKVELIDDDRGASKPSQEERQ